MTETNEFKIIVVGDAGTGKTCMVASLLGEPIPKTYVQTQGAKRSAYNTTFQNEKVDLKLWDLTGSDDFRTYTAGCFSKANGAIITYRMNDYESLTNVSSWFQNIESVLTEILHEGDTFEKLEVCVIGLQSDSKRCIVTEDQGECAARTIGCPHFTGNYKDPRDYQKMLNSLIGKLIDKAQQEKKDERIHRQRMSKKGIISDDASQPLIEKNANPSIFDCGCNCCGNSCTIL